VALVALVIALAVGYAIKAGNSDDSARPAASASPSATGAVALSSLPSQARTTIALIERGGPFPYPRNDGAAFHNNEHLLPRRPDGYYREYTVPTPGSPDRGARRIIAGGPGEFWYTDDHYETLRRVDVSR
jgi:guanyl-specific ribonuclease Sa